MAQEKASRKKKKSGAKAAARTPADPAREAPKTAPGKGRGKPAAPVKSPVSPAAVEARATAETPSGTPPAAVEARTGTAPAEKVLPALEVRSGEPSGTPEQDAPSAEARAVEPVAEVPASARRGPEETLDVTAPPEPVDVPGFEDEVSAEAVPVEVPDDEDESLPAEAEGGTVEAEGPGEAPRASEFFTSDSPGAEPHRMGTRFSGLLSLAREVAFQALASEQLGRTVGSAQGVLGAALTSLGVGGGRMVDEYGKDGTLSGVLQPVLDFLYERYWRVSVQGASHVPTGPVLLVANHSGALPLDGPVLQQSLTRERPDLQEARWLAEDQVFHAPMLGTLMNRLGAVRACPENALRLLDELRPIIVFPEGIQGIGKPFAQRYQLKRFGRGGFVKLALRTGAPIVPVAIVGAEETVPLLAKLPAGFLGLPYLPVTPPPLPARWTIRFGEPIGVGDVPPEAAEDLSEVQRLTERTREAIQGMLQALLRERRSVFGG